MATKSISQLDTQATANETDLFEVAIVDANSASGYASKKESAAAIADAIVGAYQYPLRITGTTAKTIAGAINELKNLVDLLPQFAIEVVQTLPVSDISETTIYLVPASDPEQGNYYEEYIYVNNAWELVGTTAVDLSGYYTSAQVDTLLAAKADSASLATVATSGAYSDLSGKPTIDTALDNASTNAVENRAVASEINSIKSDISVDGSASGDIATFVDGSDNPLKELEISIEAVQSGSGDPSPTNVRPISGWDGCVVSVVGKNLMPLSDANNTYNVNKQYFTLTYTENGVIFTPTLAGSLNAIWKAFVVKPEHVDKTITISYLLSGGVCGLIRSDTTDGELNNTGTVIVNGMGTYTIKSTDVGRAIGIRFGNSTGQVQTLSNLMLEFGSSASAYEPYTSTTYPITWQSTAGTVYGGMIDVKTGELTVSQEGVNFGDLTWTRQTSGANSIFVSYISNKKNGAVICSGYKYIGAKSNEDLFLMANYSCGTHYSAAQVFAVKDDDYATADAFKTAMTDVQLVYPLATPITYQLTPIEVRSLLGQNNVWADCGSITELKYTRDLNLCINDIIARIEALEGGSSNRSLSLSPTLTKSIVSDSDTAEGKTEETEEETKEEAQNDER